MKECQNGGRLPHDEVVATVASLRQLRIIALHTLHALHWMETPLGSGWVPSRLCTHTVQSHLTRQLICHSCFDDATAHWKLFALL